MKFFTFSPMHCKKHQQQVCFFARMGQALSRHSKRASLCLLLLIVLHTGLHAANTDPELTKAEIYLELKGVSLLEAFEEIESQTPFRFTYEITDVADIGDVHITGVRQSTAHLLDQLLSNTELTYKQLDHRILILPADNNTKADFSVDEVYLGNGQQDNITVRGRVTDVDGNGISGVSVSLRGTGTGAATDASGSYSINVPKDGTLVFSYVGFLSREIAVSGQQTINVTLEEESTAIEEVVVTALGIEREQRSLTYSTQSVGTTELTEARELNVVTSLQGKVPGLSLATSGAGVGASNRVVLRGNRSISGDSQPLYVIDGVPIVGDPSDLNPDNIASLNILQGPNAAALYGSAAQNGVIIIETKRGRAGVTAISVNHTSQVMSPIHIIPFQNSYAQGISGGYQPNAESSWGPRMEGQMVNGWSIRPEDAGQQYSLTPQANNISDAFQNGYNVATNVSATMGGERMQGVLTYTRTDAEGIVPGNRLGRNNLAVRLNGQLTDRLTIDAKLDYMKQVTNNSLIQDINNFNVSKQVYMMPRNIRTEDAKNYTYIDPSGVVLQNYWTPGSTLGLNPYFLMNRASRLNPRERTIGMASLSYQFTEELSLMARASFDNIYNGNEERLSRDFYARALNGRYTVTKSNSSLFNGDFLLTYNKQVSNDWNFNVNFGGNIREESNSSLSSNTGVAMIVPDFWTLSNTLDGLTSDNPGPNTSVQSLYAFGHLGWKNAIFLDITGRNDWSSTLPAANRSYFYPSVGLSTILSDLISTPTWITFAKLRASWAKVGSSGPAYMLSRTARFIPGGNNGFLELINVLPNPDLRPEETNSYEFGLDLRLFNDRLGFNLTGYKTNTLNQLFTVALPPGSGASAYFTNGGDVENRGIEMSLMGTPFRTTNFRWESNLIFSRNRNFVNEINDERPKLIVGSDQSFRDFVVIQGEPFGQIFSIGWLRDEQGNVIVGDNGVPLNSGTRDLSVANSIPDWMGSFSNTFSYKNLSFSFLIDHRQGGTVLSVTDAMLKFEGLTEETLIGREGGLIFGQNLFPEQTAVKLDGTPNDIATDAQTFWRATGGVVNPVGEAFVESMTNTRLREVTLGFSLPASLIERLPVSGVKLSLVGRNLLFLYRESKTIDPDITAGTGVISEGQSSFSPPTTRSYGLNLKIDF